MSALPIMEAIITWFGPGPGAPKYSQLVGTSFMRTTQFGDDTGAGADERLVLQFDAAVADARVVAPCSGMLWRVPDLFSPELTDAEKSRVQQQWPRLRKLSGARFNVSDAREPGSDALLLEVWPSGFRRLEYLFSSLEAPVSADDWEIPQAPAPRWFWISGFDESELWTTMQTLAIAQHPTGPPLTIDGFMKGLAPMLVAAGDVLGTFDGGASVAVRAFDQTGLPIDPGFVFDTFSRLATDSDFQRLHVAHPDGGTWKAVKRHVLVFTDHDGFPYQILDDDLTLPGEIPEPLPDRVLRILTPGTGDHAIPDNGVLVFPETGSWTVLSDELVGMSVDGPHVRLGLEPHGDLAQSITVSFAPTMFARLRVIDLRRWFPKNLSPRSQLSRYTEGNLLTPYIDGRDFFRELYRTVRATFEQVPDDPAAFDPRAPLPAADASRSKIVLSNAWIDPQSQLIGRRGMIAAPRTQSEPTRDLPEAADLLAGLSIVAVQAVTGLPDVAGSVPGERQWWLVSRESALPPGAYIDIRQIQIADDFHGDDPRLPGIELNADIYGIAVPLRDDTPTALAFASTSGRFALPAIYSVTDEPRARMRIVLWELDEDTEKQRVRGYGEVLLPSPASPLSPPPNTGQTATSLRLEYDGRPGIVVVVIDADELSAPQSVVVLNPRSGEVVAQDFAQDEEVRIDLTDFAMQDHALVGFLSPGDADPANCTHFFELCLGHPEFDTAAAALQAGAAPSHATEIAGALRSAIAAGADVRLLAWKDPTRPTAKQLVSTLGAVNVVNAQAAGHRGQAIWDVTGRESFHVHHQKGTFFRTADLKVTAFLGGIDILQARWDTPEHLSLNPDRPSSTWHDIQCRVQGKASWDVYRNIRERWNAAHARPDLVGSDPGRSALPLVDGPEWGPTPVVDDPLITKSDGPHVVQITRTIAPRIEPYSGAVPPFNFTDPDTGDLSVRASYRRVIAQARRFLYIEDQYFWDLDIAQRLHDRLFTGALEFIILLLPKRLSELPTFDQVVYGLRRRSLHILLYGNPDGPTGTPLQDVTGRVALFTIAARDDLDPIYVHCKVAVADDLWMSIGSANLTRRSMTWDSELNAASVDTRIRRGAHRTAREFRVECLTQHLWLRPQEAPMVEDPRAAFDMIRAVLNHEMPWRRTQIQPMDLNHTHYGPIVPDFDPFFADAIRVIADPDGEQFDTPMRLIDLPTLFSALSESHGSATFGGLGRLRFTFDVSALGDPATIQVSIEMWRQDPPPAPPAPISTHVQLGPFLASQPGEAGVLAIGVRYELSAVAHATSAPGVAIGSASVIVEPTEFLTAVAVVF